MNEHLFEAHKAKHAPPMRAPRPPWLPTPIFGQFNCKASERVQKNPYSRQTRPFRLAFIYFHKQMAIARELSK